MLDFSHGAAYVDDQFVPIAGAKSRSLTGASSILMRPTMSHMSGKESFFGSMITSSASFPV